MTKEQLASLTNNEREFYYFGFFDGLQKGSEILLEILNKKEEKKDETSTD